MHFSGARNIYILFYAVVVSQCAYVCGRLWKRQICRGNQFQCNSGDCIAQFLLCDGELHCKDGSDETSEICRNLPCPSYAFRCDYGACVEADAKCNSVKNCADNSDEENCASALIEPNVYSCKNRQYSCKSGACIDPFLLCDGNKDCDDASDETEEECKNFMCPSFAFRCDYGACIPRDNACNNVEECADGSDEKPHTCGSGMMSITENSTPLPQIPTPSTIVPEKPIIGISLFATEKASTPFPLLIPEESSTPVPLYVTEKLNMPFSITTNRPTTLRPPSGACILPPQPANGQYTLGGCTPPCYAVPGNQVDTAIIIYTCNTGYNLKGVPYVLCNNGWSSPFPTCSQVACSPLDNPSREFVCKLQDMRYNCSEPMEPGTRASVKCSIFYENGPEFSHFDTICLSDGKWSRDVSSCTPTCGKKNPEAVAYISHGEQAKFGEYPWHAGIYRPYRGKIIQSCSGSIISERYIVTASHCFWDDTESKMVDYSDYRIVVGKYFLDWDKTTKHTQYPEIERVILHEMFRGYTRNYENDIAIITLKKGIQMTQAVRPICVDYSRKYSNKFISGNISGIVVGWGITEKMEQSEVQHTATLPYVNFQICENEVPVSFRPFLTYDKFCAGYRNGTSVCPGDSGGGYAVQFSDNKWYLMGIVSVGVPPQNADNCNIMQYTTFTRINDHYDFIKAHAT